MSNAAGYIVKLSNERRPVFNRSLRGDFFTIGRFGPRRDDAFTEPVPEFQHSRNQPLVCFVVDESGRLSHVAKGRRGQSAGTGLRRLTLTAIVELDEPLAMDAIVELVPMRVRKFVVDRLARGGKLRSKSLNGLVDAITVLAPNSSERLDQYREPRENQLRNTSTNVRRALAEQKEAVATALNIAGIERESLREWQMSRGSPPASFLDGLQQVSQREDVMIVNDLFTFPGHELVRITPHASVVFQNETSRLTVVLANRQPLELVLGTDLIYFNETFSCFLFVQYKAMEDRDEKEAVFRLPDLQLDKEIARMELTVTELASARGGAETDSFRLHENPFFFKLCPRLRFNPDDTGLTPGMYIPLEYWKLLVADSRTVGPKGGKVVSYKNARRYFDNREFTALAAKAWVGTTVSQSRILERVIRESLDLGRAVAIAVHAAQDGVRDGDGAV